jgi:hypothetical protein
MTAGADAGDQGFERLVAKVLEDFLCGRTKMTVDVRRVFELLRHPSRRRFARPAAGAFDRALHALFLGREIEGGAISAASAGAAPGSCFPA